MSVSMIVTEEFMEATRDGQNTPSVQVCKIRPIRTFLIRMGNPIISCLDARIGLPEDFTRQHERRLFAFDE